MTIGRGQDSARTEIERERKRKRELRACLCDSRQLSLNPLWEPDVGSMLLVEGDRYAPTYHGSAHDDEGWG